MRALYIVMLSAVALLTTDAASTTATLISPAVVQSLAADGNDIASKRLLRTEKETNEIERAEERGITLSGLKNMIKSGAEKTKLKLRLTSGKSALETFKTMNLENQKGFLFGTSEFLTWAKYVTKTDKKNAGATMLKALLKHYDDATLARMIESAKTSANPARVKFATDLQSAQFTKWTKAGTRADDIGTKLKGLKNQDLWATKDKELVKAYRNFVGEI